MPEEVREEVCTTIEISNNIASRAEAASRLIRGLDGRALPVRAAVENHKRDGLLTVEPEVEAPAMAWRASLLAGDDKTQEVFGLMSPSGSGASRDRSSRSS